MSRDEAFLDAAQALGHSFDGEIKRGGNYLPLVRVGDTLYVSGQVPRVGDTVVVTGRVGRDVTLEQAQLAARICAMRALALLQRSLGSLEKIRAVPKVNVYIQCADGFIQQSEVADAAWSPYSAPTAPMRARRSASFSCRRTPRWSSTSSPSLTPAESSCCEHPRDRR